MISKYLNTLLNPEKTKGSKIPTKNFTPSCSFQLHSQYKIPTGNYGNCEICFNPYFLASDELTYYTLQGTGSGPILYTNFVYASSFFVRSSMLGLPNWQCTYMGQTIPDLYSSYRLVSAEIKIKYIGKIQNSTGYIYAAVINENTQTIGCEAVLKYESASLRVRSRDFDLDKYNKNNIRGSYYYREKKCLEGLRMIYYPLDESYKNYKKIFKGESIKYNRFDNNQNLSFSISNDYFNSGFKWIIFIEGCEPYSYSLLMDIYCNFECLPNLEYINYLPMSVDTSSYISENVKMKILEILNKEIHK